MTVSLLGRGVLLYYNHSCRTRKALVVVVVDPRGVFRSVSGWTWVVVPKGPGTVRFQSYAQSLHKCETASIRLERSIPKTRVSTYLPL